MDRLLDGTRVGPMYLRKAEIAQIVVTAIRRGDFELHAWVVMSNHVHLLITPSADISKITKSIKGFTARAANRVLGFSGPFWQQESYDRLVRDAAEFGRIKRYIEWNPVRAGIVEAPEEFPWSSATSSRARSATA
jgi:REP element-mobilizing transposase RayT